MASSRYYCSCSHSKDNVYQYPELKEMLPVEYNYTVCEWLRESENNFECRFRVNVSTKDGALAWLEAFKHSSNTLYTVDKTFTEDTQNIIYKVVMKCYRNTRPRYNVKRAHPQHTNCQARLAITVKRIKKSKKYQSKDIHMNDFPMMVLYRHIHNHDYNPVKALQKHSTNPEVTDMFVKYFEEGLSPVKAIEQYIIHLKKKYREEYHKALVDERLFPTKDSVYKLYYKAFSKAKQNSKRKQMLESLKSRVIKFNAEMKGRFSELRIFKDENFVIVTVSPIMKRVLLNIAETSDVLFMDSLDNADNYGTKVFTFLTKCCYGALPVVSVIISTYREDVLIHAFEMFKSFLNSNCFDGRGVLGPKVFMVEDNDSVKSCVKKAFPNASVVLNSCLLLRDSWKYLVNANVPHRRLHELYYKIKELFFCTSEEKLNMIYNKLKNSSLAGEFPDYISYVENLYSKKEEWAKCFHHALVPEKEHANNILDQTINIFDDNILQMKRLYFSVSLFDYIVTAVDQFYTNKLMSLIDSQSLPNQTMKTSVDMNNYKESVLLKYGEKSFKVKSLKGRRDYFVELDIGVCNCRFGRNGADCEHQSFVSNKYHAQTHETIPINLEQKALLIYIATGQTDILSSYLADFCDIQSEDNLERASEVLILEPNASAILEFEGHIEDEEENSDSESESENLHSEQKVRIGTLKQFQECVKVIANQPKKNHVALLAAKQFISNLKKLKTENSLILPLNCILNNKENSGHHSSTIVHHVVSNDSQPTIHSNISVKRSHPEKNINNENFTSTSSPNKKKKTTTPLIVHISQKNILDLRETGVKIAN